MKKLLPLAVCLLILGVAGCKKKNENTAGSTPVAQPQFIVGLDDSFPPMGFRDDNNKIVGFDIDLARETAKRIGAELVLQPIDWGSKELELENGNIDCIWNGLSVDPARAQSMLLSKPYLANEMIIIVKSDSKITGKEGMVGKKIGVQTGSTAVSALEKDPISTKVNRTDYENNVLAMADLEIGRIDAVVMDEVVARYQMSKDKQRFRILDDNLGQEVYAIGFKKSNTALADKVNKAMADMAADGTSDNISKKWFGEVILLK